MKLWFRFCIENLKLYLIGKRMGIVMVSQGAFLVGTYVLQLDT